MSPTTAVKPQDHVEECSPHARVTKSLLGYGLIAGPLYVLVTLAEATLRPGFDLTRHSWSLLANGSYGWIHSLNLILTGVMVALAAWGFSRFLKDRQLRASASIFLGVYGVGMIGAGIFKADPMAGFPAGTPDGPPETMTVAGTLHMVTGGIGFLGLIAACIAMARIFRAAGESRWAAFSVATGALFLVAFMGIASGAGSPILVLGFAGAVVVSFVWVALTSLKLYRQVAADDAVARS